MLRKRIFSFITTALMLIVCIVPAAADDTALARFSAEERNGVSVDGFLAKRGIPLADGVLYPGEKVCVEEEETGMALAVQTKVMETYESGAVKWLLVSSSMDLKPFEKQNYVVKKDGSSAPAKLSYTSKDGLITVDNGVFTVVFDSGGIASLSCFGRNLLGDRAEISSCVHKNVTYTTTNASAEVIDSGDVFVKVKVSAPYGDSPMRTEKTYSVTAGSNTIAVTNCYVSYNGSRYTTENGRAETIESLYESFYLDSGFNRVSTGEGQSSEASGIKSADYITAYSESADMSVSIVSKDIEKFRGAVSTQTVNGFMEKDGALIYAPILYGGNYAWQDGLSRTTHSEIVVCRGENKELDNILKTQISPPAIVVAREAFVKAGILASDKISALAEAQIKEIEWTKDKRSGKMDAGSIPYGLDSEADFKGMFEVHLAELEYNTWYGVMASGSADLFDIAAESSEAWADVMIYQGSVYETRGFGRYRYGLGNSSSEVSHAYYTEASSLYMAYLMTGNEYFYDSFYLTTDAMCRFADIWAPLSGHKMAGLTGWGNGRVSINKTLRDSEVRAAFQIRAMQHAYSLFKEERFAELAEEIGLWTDTVQEKDGSWAQIYNQSGEWKKNATADAVLYKNYIMLYTLRGHCEYYKETGNEKIFPQIQRFADYLINELGDKDWIWDPVGDKEKCETSEDKSRGKAPFQESMSSEIFLTVYEETGEEKYFNALCRVLSNYLASAKKSGFVSQRYNDPAYLGGKVNNIITGQNTTLLHIDSRLCKVFDENRECAKRMGYEGLVAIFADGADQLAQQISSSHHSTELGANLYGDERGRYLYVSNNSGYYTGEWEKDIELHIAGARSLWTEVDCEFDNLYETTVKKHLDTFGYVYSKELPIRLKEATYEISARAEQYSEDTIAFAVTGSGGKAVFTAENGDFPIVSGEGYTVTVSGGKDKQIYVKQGGLDIAGEDGLEIVLDFNENNIAFRDISEHWSCEDILNLYSKGIIKGTGDGCFSPEKEITRREAILFVMRSLGVSDENAADEAKKLGILGDEELDAPAMRAEIISYCVKALTAIHGENMAPDKISANSYLLAKRMEDDAEAVRADAENLVFDSVLYDNLVLPSSGIYGSSITWRGGNSRLGESGRVTRPSAAEGDATASLTAEVRRGTEVVSREFEFTIASNAKTSFASGSFADGNINIDRLQGDFTVEFDATPGGISDWVIGLHDDSIVPSAYSQIPLIVRFYTNGRMDSYSGTGYRAEGSREYTPGETYHFKIVGSTTTKTFSAEVTDGKGESWMLADNNEFRATAISASGSFTGISSVVASGTGGAITNLTAAAGSDCTGKSGYQSAAGYYGITYGDANVMQKENLLYFSTKPEYMSAEGRYIKVPEENTEVFILGVSKDITLFEDFDTFDESFYQVALTAQAIGLVRGDDSGRLNPDAFCRRGEIAGMIRRFYDLSKAKSVV